MFRVTAAVAASAFALFVLMFVAFLLGLQPHAALGATIAVLLVLLPLVLALELLGVFAWLLRGPR